jgi:hypothetical protein
MVTARRRMYMSPHYFPVLNSFLPFVCGRGMFANLRKMVIGSHLQWHSLMSYTVWIFFSAPPPPAFCFSVSYKKMFDQEFLPDLIPLVATMAAERYVMHCCSPGKICRLVAGKLHHWRETDLEFFMVHLLLRLGYDSPVDAKLSGQI